MQIQDIIILLSAVSGLSVAFYIAAMKMKKKPLICPIGSDCTVVVTSDYSKFMGINLEFMGLIYYVFVIATTLYYAYFPQLSSPFSWLIIPAISVGAFLFSLYLTSVQLFKLKHWCTWCLSSAFFTTVIFIMTILK